MKKIESISGPLSVIKTDGYQSLLDYWSSGGEKPDSAFAANVLMGLTDLLKIENCIYQKDVIDAMFRQRESDTAIPFVNHILPGLIYATDFDMGSLGIAYFDSEVANFQVSTGTFTSWNNGWTLRNDGIDIERSDDRINTNGLNVGWCESGEWMQYQVDVTESGTYDIHIRVAANDDRGKFHFQIGDSDLTPIIDVPASRPAGWQSWQTITVRGVPLATNDRALQFHIDRAGFNIGSFEFTKTGNIEDSQTSFVSASTINPQWIQLNLNKPMTAAITDQKVDFQIWIGDIAYPIEEISYDPGNPRQILLSINRMISASDVVRISYSGQSVEAMDATILQKFERRIVQNRIAIIHALPGKIEAEDFNRQSGIQLENTSDIGGGQNVGFLDVGDFMEYTVNVSEQAIFEVEYRTASLREGGALSLHIVEEDGSLVELHSVDLPVTGGWQSWITTSAQAALTPGQYQLRVVITQSQFNINWINFATSTALDEIAFESDLLIYPNPVIDQLNINGQLRQRSALNVLIVDALGRQIISQQLPNRLILDETLDISNLTAGPYLLVLETKNGERSVIPFAKVDR